MKWGNIDPTNPVLRFKKKKERKKEKIREKENQNVFSGFVLLLLWFVHLWHFLPSCAQEGGENDHLKHNFKHLLIDLVVTIP